MGKIRGKAVTLYIVAAVIISMIGSFSAEAKSSSAGSGSSVSSANGYASATSVTDMENRTSVGSGASKSQSSKKSTKKKTKSTKKKKKSYGISDSAIVINMGDRYQLHLYDTSNASAPVEVAAKKGKWTSSKKKVASVSKGVVKGVKAGKATIKVKVGSKTLKCQVTVVNQYVQQINDLLAEFPVKIKLKKKVNNKTASAAYLKEIQKIINTINMEAQFGTSDSSSVNDAAQYGTVQGTMASAPIPQTITGGSPDRISNINIKAEYGIEGGHTYLHGMFYIAKMTADETAKAVDGQGKMKLNKGKKVLVIRSTGASKKEKSIVCVKSGDASRILYVKNKNLKYLQYVFNSAVAFSNAQVEEWVTKYKMSSPTNWAVFVSKYNQRLYVLKKDGDRWVVTGSTACTTGGTFSGDYPNDVYGVNHCKLLQRTNALPSANNLPGVYYSSVGGNAIHAVPTSALRHPSTLGGIGLNQSYLDKIMELPLQTRVVTF